MARVTVEDCIDKVDNRFDLVLMASHRARAISSGAQIYVARDNDKNPVVALREIAELEIGARRSEGRRHSRTAKARRSRRTGGRGRAADDPCGGPRASRRRRRGAIRPHDRRRSAARARRHGAAARTGRRRRISEGFGRDSFRRRSTVGAARLGGAGTRRAGAAPKSIHNVSNPRCDFARPSSRFWYPCLERITCAANSSHVKRGLADRSLFPVAQVSLERGARRRVRCLGANVSEDVFKSLSTFSANHDAAESARSAWSRSSDGSNGSTSPRATASSSLTTARRTFSFT